jgi:fermentation-respiration switch protein FrsA (DUF1100 family)
LYIPKNAKGKLPAVAFCGPFGAVKEQSSGLYAQEMAQRGVVAIPGSSNHDHLRENISVFHFSLSDEEMSAIAILDRNEKHDWY